MPDSVTAAILLGATSFAKHSYGTNLAFLRSKQDFRSYLQSDSLNLPDEAILDLFDSYHSPSEQLRAIGRFLDQFSRQAAPEALRNLIVYYVGHGYFCGRRQEYQVALACLETGYESTTGLKIVDLADEIKHRARAFRRFIFLDCCFAAEALAEFQGGADDAIAVKAKSAFAEDSPRRAVAVPRRGTVLFCAADKDSVARSPRELEHTMFTDALLDVLNGGDPSYPPELSLNDIRDLTWEKLGTKSEEPVRPALYTPDQSEGDIAASVALFPNAWHRRNAYPPSPPTVPAQSPPKPTLVEKEQKGDIKDTTPFEGERAGNAKADKGDSDIPEKSSDDLIGQEGSSFARNVVRIPYVNKNPPPNWWLWAVLIAGVLGAVLIGGLFGNLDKTSKDVSSTPASATANEGDSALGDKVGKLRNFIGSWSVDNPTNSNNEGITEVLLQQQSDQVMVTQWAACKGGECFLGRQAIPISDIDFRGGTLVIQWHRGQTDTSFLSWDKVSSFEQFFSSDGGRLHVISRIHYSEANLPDEEFRNTLHTVYGN